MENNMSSSPVEKDLAEVSSLIKYISSNEEFRFDDVKESSFQLDHCQSSASQPLTPVAEGIKNVIVGGEDDEPVHMNHDNHSVSISMPVTPATSHLSSTKRVFFSGETVIDDVNRNDGTALPTIASSGFHKCYSQPMPKGSKSLKTREDVNLAYHPSMKGLKDKRFDSFKTWSGKLERQLTNLRGKSIRETESENDSLKTAEVDKNLPVHRYYDALQGPELDKLRDLEETVLPQDKTWPFLLRFPVSTFGICLGISSQAILWKTLATSPSTKFLHIPLAINLILWFISIAVIAVIFSIYLLKLILYFEAVRREYYHPIRINFFFAPWIALLFLALGVPPAVANNVPQALWYILMTPILCLELKLYGQWMSGGQRRLSKVANPSNHLSIVGNFVGALLGASMGLREGPIFFFAVGLAHYTVLFVTLYQRLPTNETLPKDLHPVFFLFVAAPSVASMAWAKIQGSFDNGSRILYFIALFLYSSLAVRINFFRGIEFSLAWWAYTFPMTGAAIATIRYSNEVTNILTESLCITLSSVSTLTVTALLVTTIVHAFILRDLFPNDLAIAISDKKRKPHRKWFHLGTGTADPNIENFLKFAVSNNHNDLEASTEDPTSDETETTTQVLSDLG